MASKSVTNITRAIGVNENITAMEIDGKDLAGFLAAVITMATSPRNQKCGSEYWVSCNQKTCRSEIVSMIDQETDFIYWMCPQCGDQGVIRRWRGTLWDMSKQTGIIQ